MLMNKIRWPTSGHLLPMITSSDQNVPLLVDRMRMLIIFALRRFVW